MHDGDRKGDNKTRMMGNIETTPAGDDRLKQKAGGFLIPPQHTTKKVADRRAEWIKCHRQQSLRREHGREDGTEKKGALVCENAESLCLGTRSGRGKREPRYNCCFIKDRFLLRLDAKPAERSRKKTRAGEDLFLAREKGRRMSARGKIDYWKRAAPEADDGVLPAVFVAFAHGKSTRSLRRNSKKRGMPGRLLNVRHQALGGRSVKRKTAEAAWNFGKQGCTLGPALLDQDFEKAARATRELKGGTGKVRTEEEKCQDPTDQLINAPSCGGAGS